MRYVWDETKRTTNLATHGLDLADAEWLAKARIVVPGRQVVRGSRRSFKLDSDIADDFSSAAHMNKAFRLVKQLRDLGKDSGTK